jgi:hypothetical protein
MDAPNMSGRISAAAGGPTRPQSRVSEQPKSIDLSKYELIKVLAEGSYGKVLLA